MPWRPDHPTLFRRPSPRQRRPMRVVVTGATGNVGTAVLRTLADEPRVREIVGVARRRPGVARAQGDLDAADVAPRRPRAASSRGADAVVHLAWLIQPSRDERTTRARERRGQPPGLRGRRPRRRAARSSTRRRSAPTRAGPKDRAVDESWPTTGIADLVLLAPQGGGRARCSTTRGRAPARCASCACGPGSSSSARRPRRSGGCSPARCCPAPLVRRVLIPVVPSIAAAALPGRARARRRRGVPARGCSTRRARRLQRRGRAGPRRPELARLLGARAVRVPAARPARPAGLTWRARLQPTPAGWVDIALGVPDHGHRARARGAGLDPAPHGRRGAAGAARRACARSAGSPTPPLDPGRAVRPQREVLTGLGGERRAEPPPGRAPRVEVRTACTLARPEAEREGTDMAQQHFDRLTAIDASFLHQEGPTSHMHVGAVRSSRARRRLRATCSTTCAAACTSCRATARSSPPRRCRPGRPLWVDDPSFNLEYHVRQTALPRPGARSSCCCWPRGSSPSRSTAPSRCGRCGSSRACSQRAGAGFALISKTHHCAHRRRRGRRPRDRCSSTSTPSRATCRTPTRPGSRTPSRRRAELVAARRARRACARAAGSRHGAR